MKNKEKKLTYSELTFVCSPVRFDDEKGEFVRDIHPTIMHYCSFVSCKECNPKLKFLCKFHKIIDKLQQKVLLQLWEESINDK